jgi:hypothetical protein
MAMSLGLAPPSSPMGIVIRTQIAAIDAELARRLADSRLALTFKSKQLRRAAPGLFAGAVTVAQSCRYFTTRVVRYLAAEAGIHDFLDIEPGMPFAEPVHEVAQRAAPDDIVFVSYAETLEQEIYEAFVTSDGHQVDQLCEDWLELARHCGIAVDDEHGDLRPDILDAISRTVSAAIWYGLTTGYLTLTGGYHIPRKYLPAWTVSTW